MYVDTLEGTNSDENGWMWTAPPSMPLVSSKQTDGSVLISSQCAPLYFEIRLSPWDWDGRDTSSPSLILSMHTPYCRSKASLKHTLWWWWALTLGCFMIVWARDNSSEVHTHTGRSSWILTVLTAVFLCNCVQPRVCQCASLSWNPSAERLAWYDPNLPPGGQTTTSEEEEEEERSQDCFTQQLQLLLAVFFKRRDGKIWLHCLLQCEQTKLWNKYLKYFAPITLNSLQKHFKLFCLILKLLKVQWWMNGLALVYVSRYFKLFYILVYICYDFESSAAVLMLLSLFKKRPFFSKEMIWFKWVKRKYNWQSRIKNVNRIMSSYVHGRMHWCSNQIRSIFDKYLLYWEVFQYFTC